MSTGGLSGVNSFWLSKVSSAFRVPPRLIFHFSRVLGFCVWASRKKSPWLDSLSVRNPTFPGGLLGFKYCPVLHSIVELFARISWLWERLNACLPECSRSVFHLQLPWRCAGRQSQPSPASPAHPAGQQRRPFVWLSCNVGGRRFRFPPQPCVLPLLQHGPGSRVALI